MKKLALTTALLTSLMGLSAPVFSDSHSAPETTTTASINKDEISILLTSWEAEVDVLAKAELAQKIQEKLGITVDGLIGRKTISAIKDAGVTTEFTKPTRAENGTTKLALAVSEGTLTQAQADTITVGRAFIKEIKDQVKVGDLTKQEAKTQINAIRVNLDVTSGKLTQELADTLTAGRASIKEIKVQVKAGDLTKQEAKTQIDAVRNTMPAKPDRDKAGGGGKGGGKP